MIYLDHNATTPVLPEVFEAMRPYFCEEWGKPSSAHKFGSKLKGVIETARAQVAELIGAQPREIIFTSCATESNNAAIHAALKANPGKRHIITSAVEHSSVLNYCMALEKEGYRVTYLPVDRDRLLKLADLENAITDDTAVVSLMWANNETGVLFPVKEIADFCRRRGVLYHCDAVQAAGKVDIDVSRDDGAQADYLWLTGHKFHAPKGVGALYVRRKAPFSPVIHGRHQERNLRGEKSQTKTPRRPWAAFERPGGGNWCCKLVAEVPGNYQTARVEDAAYLPANDGLLARKSGPWAKRKHYYLRNYCGITTKSMHKKWRLVYLDVMAGPGLCKIKETGEEFPGSPFIALDYEFHQFILIENDSQLADALKERVAKHPKASLVEVVPMNWVEVLEQGRLRFSDDSLVVAFVDPSGISQVPMKAMLQLTKNRRIDLLVTIQHSLGITWNVPQYTRSESGQTALDAFLDSGDWRQWKWNEASEFARMAIDTFSQRIQEEGFIGTRHISVPPDQPLYRFTLFSRHPLAEKFWNEILKIDEAGQRELL